RLSQIKRVHQPIRRDLPTLRDGRSDLRSLAELNEPFKDVRHHVDPRKRRHRRRIESYLRSSQRESQMTTTLGVWQVERLHLAIQQLCFAHKQIDRAIDPGYGSLITAYHLFDGIYSPQNLIGAS